MAHLHDLMPSRILITCCSGLDLSVYKIPPQFYRSSLPSSSFTTTHNNIRYLRRREDVWIWRHKKWHEKNDENPWGFAEILLTVFKGHHEGKWHSKREAENLQYGKLEQKLKWCPAHVLCEAVIRSASVIYHTWMYLIMVLCYYLKLAVYTVT